MDFKGVEINHFLKSVSQSILEDPPPNQSSFSFFMSGKFFPGTPLLLYMIHEDQALIKIWRDDALFKAQKHTFSL